MSARAWTAFAAVATLWGIPYLFIKVAVEDGVPPIFLAWARVTLAAVVLLTLAHRAGVLRSALERVRWIAIYAVIEIAIPLPLIGAGEKHVASSLAAILISSVPMIVALLAIRFEPEERATGRRAVGLAVGFAGVVALVGIDVSGERAELLGALAILLAAVGYAIGPMLMNRHFTGVDARAAMGVAMAIASVVLLPGAIADPPAARPSAEALACIVVLGLFCTAAAFVLFSTLVAEVGPGRASIITYVSPIVAVGLGMSVLGERPGAGAVAGLLLILAGSWLSTDGRLPPGRRVRVRRRSVESGCSFAEDSPPSSAGMGNGIRWGQAARMRGAIRTTLLAALLTLLALPAVAAAGGITNAGNDLRDGWYPNQPDLSPNLVSGGTFGELWTKSVDGEVYAQPLVHNGRVVVATEKNKVYSYNAETGAPAWSRTLDPAAPWQAADLGCTDLQPNIGVTATPVIDPDTGTIYLTHKSYDPLATSQGAWWLDALDPATGNSRPGFPVKFAGSADNAPAQTFGGHAQLQRPGLLLMDGVVYAAFGGLCDLGTYQGWVIGISTSGVTKTRWVAMEHDSGAGIWQSGAGIMSDGPGRIFIATGNQGAPFGPKPGSALNDTLAQSVVRLQVGDDGKLVGKDFFSPYDSYTLDTWDADFASGGVTGLRDDTFGTTSTPHLAVAVGKAGYVYLLDRDHLGGIGMANDGGGDDVVQRLGPYGGVWSRPGVWPGDGGYVYIPTASAGTSWGTAGNLHVFQYGVTASGTPKLSHVGQSSDDFGFGSGAPIITSDGATSGSGVLWTIWMGDGSGWGAQLRAYDVVPGAGGTPHLLKSWPLSQAAKFSTPGVGDGRIYVATREGYVHAFGAPVSTRLTGGSATFPKTEVNQTSQKTVTLVANGNLTINSIDVSSTPAGFSITGGQPSLPYAMTAGQQLPLTVSFTPTKPGPIGGTLSVDTDQGIFEFTLTGAGQYSGPHLDRQDPLIAFGGVPLGESRDDTIVLHNYGTEAVDIDTVTLPSAPFSVSDAPTGSTVIASGGSITIPVRFTPATTGTFEDKLVVTSNGGTVEVGLTGAGANGPKLTIDALDIGFGDVVVGQSATKELSVSNSGDLPLEIMLSKPPVSGPIVALDGLDEGTTLGIGETRKLRVQFTPTLLGTATATWAITGKDSTGKQIVTFTGNGVAAPTPTTTTNVFTTPPTTTTTTTVIPPPPPPPPVAANLKVIKRTVAKNRRTLTITGTLNAAATGKVTATLSAKVKRKPVKSTKSATPKAGRFSIKLTIPKALRRLRKASLKVAFAGDAKVKAQTLRAVTVKIRR